jgi:hypothetical protein
VAAAALAHDPAHPRHLVGGAPAQNIAAAEIELPADAVEELDRIGAR